MQGNTGTFIVVEGTDGSGKGTQFDLLAKRLRAVGQDVVTFDFPQYEEPSSYFVRQYLNGKYGSAEEVGPYTGSLFYALDRYEAAPKIRKALEEGKVVLANRYVGSNMAHQGTKFAHAEERRGYFIWLDNLEFEMLRIPRPTISFVLRVPADIAQNLVDQKGERNYTDKKRDLHEADLGHLERAVTVYDDLCQLFPKDFTRIDCVRDSKLLDIPTINDLLWEKIKPMLPAPKAAATGATVGALEKTVVQNPYVRKNAQGNFEITAEGKTFLDEAVTNPADNVYGFTDKLSSVTIAAAMARLSRRGDDMRVTLLDEFAGKVDKDAKLLQRVITGFGDDSVQQLVGQHFVVEGASVLLTKKLEWGRLAAYLEQSTRYIYFDQKDEQGHYRYYIPTELHGKLRSQYIHTMNQIFDVYSELVKKMTAYVRSTSTVPKAEQDGAWRSATKAQACDAIRDLIPLAAKATVGIFASGQAFESLVMRLLGDELEESRTTGQKLLREGRKVMPVFLERADKPDRGGATIAYASNTRNKVKELADRYLPQHHAAGDPAPSVTLLNVWPRNELDIVADILYAFSDLPLREIQQLVTAWPYQQKQAVLTAYMGERLNRRHRPGRALEKIHYSFDLTAKYGAFKDLMRHRMVDDLGWQEFSPRLGYDVPKLVEEAGLTEQFEQAFDLSLELYSALQAAHGRIIAQYAVLHGHNVRWKVTINAREAFQMLELRSSPQGHPAYRKLAQMMHAKIAEVHPQLAEAMIFLNQGEDPELTRLAAERYTQFKLKQLDTNQAGKV